MFVMSMLSLVWQGFGALTSRRHRAREAVGSKSADLKYYCSKGNPSSYQIPPQSDHIFARQSRTSSGHVWDPRPC